MFCPKCGNEIDDDADVCVKCGHLVKKSSPEYNVSKTGIGVVMALFLGVIGLIIGICLYPDGTLARKTFIKGCLITFAVCAGIGVIIFVIAIIAAAAMGTAGLYY